MFDKSSKAKVLELVAFFGKYNIHFEEKIKKLFIYYDTDDMALLKSNIVLYKTQIGNYTGLDMSSERNNTTNLNYAQRSTFKHFQKAIKPHDSILKHKEYLIESFKNMFLSAVNFDPEFLMQKLSAAYQIETTSEEYRSSDGTGLKMTYSFDTNIYTNLRNGIKFKQHVLTIYDHSNTIDSLAFEDLISKLTRYIKELTPTDETKIMLARRFTVTPDETPMPTKQKNKK